MTPFELLYYLGYSIKKRYAFTHQKKLPHKVISIGNITLGGTGKTPAAIALAEEAKKRGFNPCILTRGYKGKAKGPCFVSRGGGPLLDEYHTGDEAFLMAEKLKGVPVVKDRDRYEAGMFAIQNLKSHISEHKSEFLFILDDGFQHWKLFRDKNILLIDSTNPFGNRKLLPLGSLREPLKAISRADIIVITKTEDRKQNSEVRSRKSDPRSLVEELKQYNSKVPIFFAEHRPSAFITINGNILPLEWAKGKNFLGFCGIGNPQSFKKTLLSANIKMIGFKNFRDHYRYSQNDIYSMVRNAEKIGADWIVTTEKDIMRLKGFELPLNLVALVIDFRADKKFYEEVFSGITNDQIPIIK
ncbi:MAG: tetraacyldisaccharide 4'-kinase [Nitrospirota bacterium]